MKKLQSLLGAAMALMVLLPGCGRVSRYREQPLKLVNSTFMYRDAKNNVIMQAKKLNPTEICNLFGERGKWLVNAHNTMSPLNIVITNHSNQIYYIDPLSVDLDLINYEFVALCMKSGMLGQPGKNARKLDIEDAVVVEVIAGGAAVVGVFSVIGALATQNHAFMIPYVGAIAAPFILPARAGINNMRVKRDLRNKVLHKKEIIYPGEQLNKLIFVKSQDYNSQFTVILHEQNGGGAANIIFDVDMRAQGAV